MIKPALEEARVLVGGSDYSLLPVCSEMYSDMYTPMEVMRTLKGISSHCFVLESVKTSDGNRGRYTFLGFDPKMSISCQDGVVTVTDGEGKQSSQIDEPAPRIQAISDAHTAPKIENESLPPFCGGLVGYFSYDYAKYFEPSLNFKGADKGFFRDVDLMLFDKVIAFDHLSQKIILTVNIRTDNLEIEYERAKVELQYLKKLIRNGTRKEYPPARLKSDFKELFTKAQFCGMAEKAKGHIKAGEIGQVLLSNRCEAEFEGSLFDAYRVLRGISPSPYMFYFSGTDFEIMGASPETLVKLKDGVLYAEGGENSGSDSASKDNGANLTGLEAIGAAIPAKAVSGEPKVRAMEIIDGLEKSKRGIYGGAVGYLDFTGNMDACIAVNLAYKKNGKVFVRSGAAITADSVPESAYAECAVGSQAVKAALERANKGMEE